MNITAQFNLGKPADGRHNDPESPLRILILADWLGDTPASVAVGERRPVSIDIDNFHQIMARMAPGLALDGHDNLSFLDIEDFHPDRLCQNLFALKNLILLYKGLDDPARIRELKAELQESEDASTSADDGQGQSTDLERLLGGRPPDQARETDAESHVRKLLGELVSPHLIDTRATEPHRQAIIGRLTEELEKVLRNPRFQSLEAGWRGLWWLVSQLVSEEVKIALLPMTRREFMEDLQSAGTNLAQTAIHRHAVGSPDQPPWSLLLGLYEFGPQVDDIMALTATAMIAEVAGAPFVTAADPRLVGCSMPADLDDPERWASGPDGEALELWNSLRQSASGHWISLVLPHWLARLPYGPDTDPISSFDFTEDPAGGHTLPLANGALAVAAALGINFENHGGAMDAANPVALDDLPGFSFSVDGEARFQSAVEVPLPDRAISELVQHGISPLVGAVNRTDVHVPGCYSVTGKILAGRWNR